MTLWFHAAFICLHVFSSSHDQHDNAILKWWKLCMHFLFQSTSRSISHQKDVVVRVYMILLQNFVPEWNSCSTTTTTTHTGVTRASMTFCSNRMVWCKQNNTELQERTGVNLRQCIRCPSVMLTPAKCTWVFLGVAKTIVGSHDVGFVQCHVSRLYYVFWWLYPSATLRINHFVYLRTHQYCLWQRDRAQNVSCQQAYVRFWKTLLLLVSCLTSKNIFLGKITGCVFPVPKCAPNVRYSGW